MGVIREGKRKERGRKGVEDNTAARRAHRLSMSVEPGTCSSSIASAKARATLRIA